jgi:hypothetical protein
VVQIDGQKLGTEAGTDKGYAQFSVFHVISPLQCDFGLQFDYSITRLTFVWENCIIDIEKMDIKIELTHLFFKNYR